LLFFFSLFITSLENETTYNPQPTTSWCNIPAWVIQHRSARQRAFNLKVDRRSIHATWHLPTTHLQRDTTSTRPDQPQLLVTISNYLDIELTMDTSIFKNSKIVIAFPKWTINNVSIQRDCKLLIFQYYFWLLIF